MSSGDVDMLVEMGFERNKAERALQVTGNQGVEPAMEWLLAHADEALPAAAASTEQPMETELASTPQGEGEGEGEKVDNQSPQQEAKSLKCDECGRLFKSQLEVEFHAAKSGHSSFSESTEEKKPLTEEEKREQLKKLEEKMRQKRLEREEQEKKEALEREKLRIKSGKEMIAAKKKLQEDEMKKLVEQRKREKLEEKLARQRVKDQIEQDKIARRAKFGMSSPQNETQEQVHEAAPVVQEAHAAKDYSQTRLQIRLTNGQALTQTFGAKEQLSAVRLYVEMNRTDSSGPFTLMTNFPKKVFSEEDYEKPLDLLAHRELNIWEEIHIYRNHDNTLNVEIPPASDVIKFSQAFTRGAQVPKFGSLVTKQLNVIAHAIENISGYFKKNDFSPDLFRGLFLKQQFNDLITNVITDTRPKRFRKKVKLFVMDSVQEFIEYFTNCK